MTKRIFSICSLAAFLWAAGAHPASAQTSAINAATTPKIYQIPFKEFMSRNEQVILRNTAGVYAITIPVSERLDIQNAVFHLEYSSSINLLDERSQLRIELNDQVIAQIPLRHAQPEGAIDIRLPKALLKAGFNQLAIVSSQHYAFKCEDPTAPELWTQVNTDKSFFSFETRLKNIPGKLSELDELFDRKSWGQQKMNIVVADSEINPALKWGALAAQGAAVRFQYVPLEVSRLSSVVSGADNIVIGTTDQLPSLGIPLSGVEGSYIALKPLPGDPTHFALILSGRNPAEVQRAVAAFGQINFPFPDSSAMTVSKLDLPTLSTYQTQKVARAECAYRFSDLGFNTTTIQGWTHGDAPNYFEINLNLAPDIYAPETSQIEFQLHFAHGAGLRQDSVLNLYVNNVFENAIYLNNINGAAFIAYRLDVPIRTLKPGPNVIRFVPAMVPLQSDFCEIIQEQNLLITLFDDSIVKIPRASHYAELPNLKLFNATAFPFASTPTGSDLAVQVAAKDNDTVAAAWTLMAKLAQKAGGPFADVDISFEQASTDRNLIVVGSVGQISSDVIKASPFNLGEINQIAYRQSRLLTTEESGNQTTHMEETGGGAGALGLAMQFESPYDSGKSVFLVTAQTADLLAKRVFQLVQPTLWGSMDGNVSVWGEDSISTTSQRVGATYHVGSLGLNNCFDYYMSKDPWLMVVGIVLLIAALALVIRQLLKNYSQRHPRDGQNTDAI